MPAFRLKNNSHSFGTETFLRKRYIRLLENINFRDEKKPFSRHINLSDKMFD